MRFAMKFIIQAGKERLESNGGLALIKEISVAVKEQRWRLRTVLQNIMYLRQIRGAQPSTLSEIQSKLSMVEHDQDFICAIITGKFFGA